jgi:hypothetical protein
VVEAAPSVGERPARGGTPFSGALVAAAASAGPAPATAPTPAAPAVQPAGNGAASIAAETLVAPAAAAAAAAQAAAPYPGADAPAERPGAEHSTEAVSVPTPLPPPSPPPSPPPPPSPQEQHEQRQRTDACGTTPEAASREPDVAVGHAGVLAAALPEREPAASLPSSPALAPHAQEEQLDSARSSRKRGSSSTRRSKRRSRKEERAAGSKAARAHSPEYAAITAVAVEQQSPARKRRWDQRERPVEHVDEHSSKAAPAQLLAPAALTAETAVVVQQQPSSRRRRWDQRERTVEQKNEHGGGAAPAHQSPPLPQLSAPAFKQLPPPPPATEQPPPLPPRLTFKLPVSAPKQLQLRIKLRLPVAATQAFAREASPPHGSSAQPGSGSRNESCAGRGHSAYVPPDCQDVAPPFRNRLLEVEEALVAELQVCSACLGVLIGNGAGLGAEHSVDAGMQDGKWQAVHSLDPTRTLPADLAQEILEYPRLRDGQRGALPCSSRSGD